MSLGLAAVLHGIYDFIAIGFAQNALAGRSDIGRCHLGLAAAPDSHAERRVRLAPALASDVVRIFAKTLRRILQRKPVQSAVVVKELGAAFLNVR